MNSFFLADAIKDHAPDNQVEPVSNSKLKINGHLLVFMDKPFIFRHTELVLLSTDKTSLIYVGPNESDLYTALSGLSRLKILNAVNNPCQIRNVVYEYLKMTVK